MGTYTDSTTQDLTAVVTWSSSNASVATISNAVGSKGLASTVAAGSTTITATDPASGKPASATLTATAAQLVSITVTPSKPTVPLGVDQQFAATGTYTDSTTQDLTAVVTWSSSNASVATISNATGSKGLAHTIATGSTTVTATHSGSGKLDSAKLTVTAAQLVSIAVTPATSTVPLGVNQQFTAMGTYTDSTTQDLTAVATWSSSNASVATVSNAAGSKGLAHTLATGNATVTATHSTSGKSASASLTVTAAQLVSIAVTPTTSTVPIGVNQQFRATGTYTDSTTQDLTAVVTWSSSNASVATVSNAAGSKGLASPLAIGSTIITATDPGTGKSASATLAVAAAQLVSIAVTPTTSTVPIGVNQQFRATGTYTDSSTQDLTAVVTWSSSNASVATISNAAGSKGLASTVATGSTTITATDPVSGKSASATLTVSA